MYQEKLNRFMIASLFQIDSGPVHFLDWTSDTKDAKAIAYSLWLVERGLDRKKQFGVMSRGA